MIQRITCNQMTVAMGSKPGVAGLLYVDYQQITPPPPHLYSQQPFLQGNPVCT